MISQAPLSQCGSWLRVPFYATSTALKVFHLDQFKSFPNKSRNFFSVMSLLYHFNYFPIWRCFCDLSKYFVWFPLKVKKKKNWSVHLRWSVVRCRILLIFKLSLCIWVASQETCLLSQTYNFCLSQKGIAIVDSPGIGETKHMTEMVTEYLTQALAFVYVINTPNSGGVKEDRVGIEIRIIS